MKYESEKYPNTSNNHNTNTHHNYMYDGNNHKYSNSGEGHYQSSNGMESPRREDRKGKAIHQSGSEGDFGFNSTLFKNIIGNDSVMMSNSSNNMNPSNLLYPSSSHQANYGLSASP